MKKSLKIVLASFLAAGTLFSVSAKEIKRALLNLKAAAGTGRAKTFNKVFIGVALMELYHHNPVLIFHTHHRICETLGCVCFAYAGGALKNDIFLFSD